MARRAITRRAALRAGGASAAAVAGLAAHPGASAQGRTLQAGERPNVLLIVADRLRADHVRAYDSDAPVATPNIDALAKESLRFEHAIAEGLPALPARRAILTGTRTYPFRDWRATPGLPAIPGWNPIWDFQPLVAEVMAPAGIHVAYVSDNPLLAGSRFKFVRRTGGLPEAKEAAATERSYLLPLRASPALRERPDPTERVMAAGLRALGELSDAEPFFLAIDAFDPLEPYARPRAYVRSDSPALTADRTLRTTPRAAAKYVDLVSVAPSRADGDRVRALYARRVRATDRWIGRLMNRLADLGLTDSTVVYLLSDGGLALGEQGVFGHPAGVSNRRAYEVPHMIRDPRGRRAGDTSDWPASTHDVAPTLLSYLRLVAPGAMDGEDLTALLDDEDPFRRPHFTSALASTVLAGNREWLMLADTEAQTERLYRTEDPDDPDDIENVTARYPKVLAALRQVAIRAAGGTLPEFGTTDAVRPRQEDDNTNPADESPTADPDLGQTGTR
jgi:arylsulfatase A-like enzyme